jgi:hypothetical protein
LNNASSYRIVWHPNVGSLTFRVTFGYFAGPRVAIRVYRWHYLADITPAQVHQAVDYHTGRVYIGDLTFLYEHGVYFSGMGPGMVAQHWAVWNLGGRCSTFRANLGVMADRTAANLGVMTDGTIRLSRNLDYESDEYVSIGIDNRVGIRLFASYDDSNPEEIGYPLATFANARIRCLF